MFFKLKIANFDFTEFCTDFCQIMPLHLQFQMFLIFNSRYYFFSIQKFILVIGIQKQELGSIHPLLEIELNLVVVFWPVFAYVYFSVLDLLVIGFYVFGLGEDEETKQELLQAFHHQFFGLQERVLLRVWERKVRV